MYCRLRVNICAMYPLKQFNKKHPITQDTLDSKIFSIIDKRIDFMKKHNLWSNTLVQTEKYTSNQLVTNLITDVCLLMSNQNIYISITSDSENSSISIEDDGEGFPKDIITKIGEPYIKSKSLELNSNSS